MLRMEWLLATVSCYLASCILGIPLQPAVPMSGSDQLYIASYTHAKCPQLSALLATSHTTLPGSSSYCRAALMPSLLATAVHQSATAVHHMATASHHPATVQPLSHQHQRYCPPWPSHSAAARARGPTRSNLLQSCPGSLMTPPAQQPIASGPLGSSRGPCTCLRTAPPACVKVEMCDVSVCDVTHVTEV